MGILGVHILGMMCITFYIESENDFTALPITSIALLCFISLQFICF
jgi:hypothetical protein